MSENNIDLTQLKYNTLSIRLSTDGFSFSIYNPDKKNGIYNKHIPVNIQRSMAANVKSFLANTSELNTVYRQVNILIHTQRFTTVPLEFFEDEQMELLFYQNLPKQNNEIILCNVLGKSNVVILFAIDKLTHILLSEHFPQARFFASISPQVEYFTSKNKPEDGHKVYVNFHENDMEVCCYDDEKLQLTNTYNVTNNDDRSYYLLNLWKQLEFDPEHDELHLTGLGKAEKNELIGFLRQFIRKVFIMNPLSETGISSSDSIEDVPFDILSLLICE